MKRVSAGDLIESLQRQLSESRTRITELERQLRILQLKYNSALADVARNEAKP